MPSSSVPSDDAILRVRSIGQNSFPNGSYGGGQSLLGAMGTSDLETTTV